MPIELLGVVVVGCPCCAHGIVLGKGGGGRKHSLRTIVKRRSEGKVKKE